MADENPPAVYRIRGEEFRVTALADDTECLEDGHVMLWARERTIARSAFIPALSVWVSCQMHKVTVDQAAAAFNATHEVIKAAVAEDNWMLLDGDTIELDGL